MDNTTQTITPPLALESGQALVGTDLNVNSASTVQALILVRIGIFTPSVSAARPKNLTSQHAEFIKHDVSKEFRKLTFAQKEGFENVTITGQRLDMNVDFKVWIAIVRAFSEHGYSSDKIILPFKQFASLCGFKSKRFDSALRNNIHNSLTKLRTQTIEFKKKHTLKSYIGGLISSASLDFENDTVELVADARLWELYKIDHQVLLKVKVLDKLDRNQTAKCLYSYLASLPNDPYPISFTRLRDRLCLTSKKSEQVRVIKNAIDKLKDIGFLDASIAKRNNEPHLIIHSRNNKIIM
jgi:hypothetical protein